MDGVTVEDLDRESFAIFRRRALETGRMAEADLNVPNKLLLEKLKLMVGGKLTRAAVLLFHPDPEKWVPSCYSKIGHFANNADLLFNDEIYGSLLVQAEKVSTPYSYIVSLGKSIVSFQLMHVRLSSSRPLSNKPVSVFNSAN